MDVYLHQIAETPNMTWQQRVDAISQYYQVTPAKANRMLKPYFNNDKTPNRTLNMSSQLDIVNLDENVREFLNEMIALLRKGDVTIDVAVNHVASQLNYNTVSARLLLNKYMSQY